MLLDLMMPKMDGFQVLEQKQQDPQIADIPVIVISAQDPNGQPIVSHYLTVSYQEGFSAPNLLACIQALSEALSPRLPSAGQAQPEMQRG
jgi:CheY-like chemotaxis protein